MSMALHEKRKDIFLQFSVVAMAHCEDGVDNCRIGHAKDMMIK